MAYIGDNPARDFVNLNAAGMMTMRVVTGMHREVFGHPGYDALHRIPDLQQHESLLESLSAHA